MHYVLASQRKDGFFFGQSDAMLKPMVSSRPPFFRAFQHFFRLFDWSLLLVQFYSFAGLPKSYCFLIPLFFTCQSLEKVKSFSFKPCNNCKHEHSSNVLTVLRKYFFVRGCYWSGNGLKCAVEKGRKEDKTTESVKLYLIPMPLYVVVEGLVIEGLCVVGVLLGNFLALQVNNI